MRTSLARRSGRDGTDEDALRRAGAEGVDRFFALTEGDNRNILAAQLAPRRFGIPTVVAKVNDPVRAEAYSALGPGHHLPHGDDDRVPGGLPGPARVTRPRCASRHPPASHAHGRRARPPTTTED